MMFVLDTNVLSAIMSAQPAPQVARWISSQVDADLYTTSICEAEILAGIAILPAGRRRDALATSARAIFLADFRGRVLPFDTHAAAAYAELFAHRREKGLPTPTIDLMIAAIARSHGASVVTRDTGGFEGGGVALINPWAV